MELQRPRNSAKSSVEIEEKPIVIKKNTRFISENELNDTKQVNVTYESELLKYFFFSKFSSSSCNSIEITKK